MTVDYRTRCDADVTDIDITEFFSHTFANLLDNATLFIQPWLTGKIPEDMSNECEGICWHLSAVDGRIQLKQGVGEKGLLVKLTASEFSGLVNDLYTPMTFITKATTAAGGPPQNMVNAAWFDCNASTNSRQPPGQYCMTPALKESGISVAMGTSTVGWKEMQ